VKNPEAVFFGWVREGICFHYEASLGKLLLEGRSEKSRSSFLWVCAGGDLFSL